jgi:DNA-binding IclR family transcriptional regulator
MSSSIAKMADVIACLVKSQMTVEELHDVTEVARDPIRRYLHALEGEGLIKWTRDPLPAGCRGTGARRFKWIGS